MTAPFGPIRQLGYIVTDIHTAMRQWLEGPGVGPFYYLEGNGALAQSGGVQVELIQLRDDSPSFFHAFVGEFGEGLHHVAFWTEHFDAGVEAALARGYVELHRGTSLPGRPDSRFAYFDREAVDGTAIEISERGADKAALFDAIADAAQRWDGTAPVRDMAALLSEVTGTPR
ncbi:VOC family protein [Pseudonocardia sp. MH-G8]|uniref:VOC family protein n=1 Tax=Pseudonocardia sp. MH-G8 TaxID=1854588 RepID=UPI000B9FEEEA|nr:VOC family protein [Pseudonocardia sp. MH-G8]OZM83111.1 glyoxalase [Pseudonocardia sp. MH-G8]